MSESENFWFACGTYDDAPCLLEMHGCTTYSELIFQADTWISEAKSILPTGMKRPLVALEISAKKEAITAYLGCLRAGWPVILLGNGQATEQCPITANYRPNILASCVSSSFGTRLVEPEVCPMSEDLAVLLSTSGTTGATKLVMLSAENIQSNAQSIAKYLQIESSDVGITTLPLNYSYGMSVLNSYLLAGGSVVLTEDSIIDAEFWDFSRSSGVTSLALVPTQFELLTGNHLKNRLPTLRYVTQAGGRLDPALARRFAQDGAAQGWKLFIMYGQTEAAPRMAYLPPEDVLSHAEAIGRPIPGGRMWIVDPQGQVIQKMGRPGELIYEGPNVMIGYALTRKDLANPARPTVLKTGDIAQLVENGYFQIVGRASRFVKLFGLRIGLDEIEARLRAEGHSAYVSGSDHGLVVFMHCPTQEFVWEVLRRQLAKDYKLPESVILLVSLDKVPVLSSGKVDYRSLADQAVKFLNEGPTEAGNGDLEQDFLRILRRSKLDLSRSFEELGGDSLAFLEAELQLSSRLGKVPVDWGREPLASLIAQSRTAARPRQRSTIPVGADLLVRLIAITFILLLHATSLSVGGGVYILTILAGYSFARFQQVPLVEGHVAQVIRSMLIPILSAYFIVLLPMAVYFHADWRWFSLIVNFDAIQDPVPHPSFLLPYWYVALYAQMIVIFALPFLLPKWRRIFLQAPFPTGTVLCILISLVLFLSSANDLPYGTQIRHPIGGLQLFCLGWCVTFAQNHAQKFLMSLLLLLSWLILWNDADTSVVIFLTVMPLIVLWVPRQNLPFRLARLLIGLGTLTLYIYIMHVPSLYISRYVFSVEWQIFAMTLTLSILGAVILKGLLGVLFGNRLRQVLSLLKEKLAA